VADGEMSQRDEAIYELGENRYGKSRIRLVTVRRDGERHDLRDLTVDVLLEGVFEAAHTSGDNANPVATGDPAVVVQRAVSATA